MNIRIRKRQPAIAIVSGTRATNRCCRDMAPIEMTTKAKRVQTVAEGAKVGRVVIV